MANTSVSIECERFGEHEIECEFSVSIENDGIGPYEYWGAKGYDYGTDYAVLDEIYECYLVRSGRVDNKEDAPKCAEIEKVVDKTTGEVKYYIWRHYRSIKPNDEIEAAVDEYVNNAPINDLIDEPDYDDRWDDYDDRY